VRHFCFHGFVVLIRRCMLPSSAVPYGLYPVGTFNSCRTATQ
jgi:hypothetical protein